MYWKPQLSAAVIARTATIVVIGVRRRMVELLDWIRSPAQEAKAAVAAPDILDHELLSARIAGRVQKFRNQRKTRCNRSDRSSFSKQSLDQLLSGMKGSAYRPTIFQAHNV